ncbi:MAG: asparagine synthase (glutamine-hydrolyzing) [Kiritimatiellae bacterium]|nr:asparagine synthase (glutamine-hydrolyzing) [Kiritimatiellia bacterium]
MCGINGIYDLAGARGELALAADVERMIARLAHRGPDSSGCKVMGSVALGAVRLSIMDPSIAGNQPMVTPDGKYVIVFNGEIYNYVELREQLRQDGVEFVGGSDTEVLLYLYARKGAACLKDLRGMFAFAIWDNSKKELFLARDRMGEKPLVYYESNGVFAFASEIKALLTLPWVKREIDPVGLHYGLYFVNAPAPYSAFKNIRKLEPATFMVVSSSGIKKERYWHASYHDVDMIKDPRECAEEFSRCFDETVRLMCRSDVPIAATLSGGLDSSAVVSSMCASQDSVDTFCVSCGSDSGESEFSAARKIADMYGTNHHEISFDMEDIRSVSEVVGSYDEPLTSFVPMHARLLAKSMSEHGKVALTGNGGDELFGGYSDHRFLQRCEDRFRTWGSLDRCGIGALANLCPIPGVRRSARKYRQWGKIPQNRFFAGIRTAPTRRFCDAVYSGRMHKSVAGADPIDFYVKAYDECGAVNLMDGFMYQQLNLLSQHSTVVIPDVSGMACSLEYRAPFLDVKMIELAMRIPGSVKVKRRMGVAGGKWIMRDALRGRLPQECLQMTKAGFGSSIPYRRWALNEWSGFIKEKLASEALADSGLFKQDSLLAMYDGAGRNPSIPLELLWGIAMTAQWLEDNF